MTCPRCSAEVSEGARFCGDCGAEQPRRCPACGNEARPEGLFCTECGAALGEADHLAATALGPRQDPLGRFMRFLAPGLAIGLAAGLVSVALSGLTVGLLGLVGSRELDLALGLRFFETEELGLRARIARSLTSPWVSQSTLTEGDFIWSARFWLLPSSLIALAVVGLAGLLVRRLVSSLSERVVALLVSALVAAGVLAVFAAMFEYTTGPDVRNRWAFSPGTYFGVVFLEVLVVGAFSFGVVALWREPFRTAVRTAAVAFVALFLAAAVAFPLGLVGSGASDPQTQDGRARDLALASNWGGAIAVAALPLALGAQATFEGSTGLSPFVYASEDAQREYLPRLADYVEDHPRSRLVGYASVWGNWQFLAYAAGGLVFLFWIIASVGVVRALGAPRSIDGLRLGGLTGAFGLLLILWSDAIASTHSSAGAVSEEWGIRGPAVIQAGTTLVAVTALAGAAYAALRPWAYAYDPLRLGIFGTPKGRMAASARRVGGTVRDQAAPAEAGLVQASGERAVDEPTLSLGGASTEPHGPALFCVECGASFASPEARFCGSCGAPRLLG